MSSTHSLRFPVLSFKRLESPYERDGKVVYIAIARVTDLPEELDQWREINPRHPKTTSGVAKQIAESLSGDRKQDFLFKNRGLTLLAETAKFDNQSNKVTVEMSNKALHGLLDGGHTFKVIIDALHDADPDERSDFDAACVKIEIIEGIKDREEAVAIVEARNTSLQVSDSAIDALLGKYSLVKEALEGESYFERVAFKQFELTDEGTRKDIDIREVLSYLICFDVESFDSRTHPIVAYSGKAAVIDRFREAVDEGKGRMDKYVRLLPKILQLRDHIYDQLPKVHNELGGRFGRLEDVTKHKSKPLPFSGKESEYSIPMGFIYPMLAAMRSLLKVEGKKCTWSEDPIEFFDSIKEELVERIADQARGFRNPNKLGKDQATWLLCYQTAELALLKRNR